MNILAIETSCDETAAAVIQGSLRGKGHLRIKSSVIASQAKKHRQFGGVVPEVAAREHVPAILPTIELALKKAQVKPGQLDYIAVTQGPGLAIALMVGINTAKALGAVWNIPVIPINHLEGHIYANLFNDDYNNNDNQTFPALILIVSGGHTMLVLMRGHGRYKVLGETVDDAAGECFDKTAKLLGLDYPGGPALARLAKNGDPQAFNFPRPMIHSKDLNFSFSGLKTAVSYKLKELQPITYNLKPDLAASIQQAIVDVLCAKTEHAIRKYHPKTIMLGGGVAANNLLRKHFTLLASHFALPCLIPPLDLTTDNAAMIGVCAYYKISKQKTVSRKQNFEAQPNLPLK